MRHDIASELQWLRFANSIQGRGAPVNLRVVRNCRGVYENLTNSNNHVIAGTQNVRTWRAPWQVFCCSVEHTNYAAQDISLHRVNTKPPFITVQSQAFPRKVNAATRPSTTSNVV